MMKLATGGWVLLRVLLVYHVTDVYCWGGWKGITSEISRAVSNAGQEVQRFSDNTAREAERFATQVKTETEKLGTRIEQETDRIGNQVQGETGRFKEQVGSWFPSNSDPEEEGFDPIPEAPPVVRGCPPLISATVEFSCRTQAAKRLNCSLPMPVGTEVKLRCKKGYYVKLDWYPESVHCLAGPDGPFWGQTPYSCVPDCGKRNTGGQPSSSKRQIVEVPWHITIYKLNAAGLYDVACSGTLITPTLVLSAASCFWDTATNKPRPPAEFKVAAGRPRVDWSTVDASLQRRDVAEIVIHERYLGRSRLLANDVALVKLTQEMKLSYDVNVACVDWIHDQEETVIAEGSNGMVASWNTSPSPLQLPFVPFLQCSDTIGDSYQEYITNDKFCGGSVDKTVTVCSTDVGTGFTLPLDTVRGQRHYVRGIATAKLDSASGECGAQKLAVFTHFSAYRKWFAKTVFEGQSL